MVYQDKYTTDFTISTHPVSKTTSRRYKTCGMFESCFVYREISNIFTELTNILRVMT